MTKFECLLEDIVDSDTYLLPIQSKNAHTICIEKEYAIFFGEQAYATNAERYVVLAHENSHVKTGMVYSDITPLVTREYCEHKAWNRTVMDILPFDELENAFYACKTSNGVSVYDLAEYLDMTVDFILYAIQLYLRKAKRIVGD